jgi:hypothetical protein
VRCGRLPKLWDTESGQFELIEEGRRIEIYFKAPNEKWRREGIEVRARFFIGERNCDQLSGFALAYVRVCPKGIPFRVTGIIHESKHSITLSGEAPSRVNRDCTTTETENYRRTFNAVRP